MRKACLAKLASIESLLSSTGTHSSSSYYYYYYYLLLYIIVCKEGL